jgi:NAD(P)-dependent dehydrogenase (short-subunit alcohol dehydrogenase family)
MASTVLITGSSSGIGRAAAFAFMNRGWNVSASMRSPDPSLFETGRNVLIPRLDVTEAASVQQAIDQTLDVFGGLDVLVNNAGYGIHGPFEGTSMDQIRRQFETNVIGLMRVTSAALPHLRKAGRGVIINLSSVSGRITIPFYSLYHASKWAIEGFSESLAYELRPLGIRVRLVEPGTIRSDFYGRSLDRAEVDTDYEPLVRRADWVMDKAVRMSGTAESVAERIVRAATSRSWRLRYPVHSMGLTTLRKVLPTRLFTELTQYIMLGGARPYTKGRRR